MSSSYRNSLNTWLSQLDVKADRVLDIGGAQQPVKGRTKSWDVGEYLIADLAEPHVGSPKPDVIVDLNNRNSTNTVLIGEGVNLIFCLEVFEYVYDPVTAMLWINQFLNLDGTAWVTFPSFYPMHQPIEDDALRYMPAGIIKLAKAVGLKVEQMIARRPETNSLQQAWSAERMRAAKGEDHAFTGFIVELRK